MKFILMTAVALLVMSCTERPTQEIVAPTVDTVAPKKEITGYRYKSVDGVIIEFEYIY